MITCDFCGETVDTGTYAIVPIPPTPGVGGNVNMELHYECVAPWSDKATKIKGKRPASTGATGGTVTSP